MPLNGKLPLMENNLPTSYLARDLGSVGVGGYSVGLGLHLHESEFKSKSFGQASAL